MHGMPGKDDARPDDHHDTHNIVRWLLPRLGEPKDSGAAQAV